MKKNTPLTIALLICLVAVGVHAYLAGHFYDLKFGGASGNAICNLSSYINCDAVTASRYATFLGVPMAMWGLFTNLMAAMIFALARFNLTEDNERTARYGFLFASFIFLMSLIMGTISFTLIGNLCLFCASAYLLSIFSFAAAWKAVPWTGVQLWSDFKSIFRTQKWIFGTIVAIPLLALLANAMVLDSRGFDNISRIISEKIAYWQTAPEQKFDTQGLIMQKGSGEPAVTIVEFADFRCPHCREAYPALDAFVESHPDVRLVFKAFPLDGTCNSAISGGGDGISCALASLAFCAEKVDHKGWQTHHFIYDHQEDFRSLPLDDAADKICKATGTSCDQLKQCAKSDETLQSIKSMAAEGERAQIQGTPSIFVNSRLLMGGQLLPIMDAAYKNIKGQ